MLNVAQSSGEGLTASNDYVGMPELNLVATHTYVYDGTNADFTYKLKAGNLVRVKVTNLSVTGTVLNLEDQTTYYYDKTWTGLPRKKYGGDSFMFNLLPGQSKDYYFNRFVEEPYEWLFNVSPASGVDAAFVRLEFYSTWP